MTENGSTQGPDDAPVLWGPMIRSTWQQNFEFKAEFVDFVRRAVRECARSVAPKEDLDDVESSVFLRIWTLKCELRWPLAHAHQEKLVREIAFGTAAQARRSKSRRVKRIESSGSIQLDGTVPGARSDLHIEAADRSCIDADDLADLWRIMVRILTERERVILIRHDMAGETIKSIAADLGIRPQRVSQIRLDALEKVRKHLSLRDRATPSRRPRCG